LSSDEWVVNLTLAEAGQSISFDGCYRCGLIFRSPRPTVEQLEQHYGEALPPMENEIMGQMGVTREQAAQRESHRFAEVFREVRQLCQSQKGHVVDIGGSSGRSLVPWVAAGWQTTLIDPGVGSRPAAHTGINEVATVKDVAASSDFKADILTSYHCVEHFLNVKRSLSEMHSLSRPGTLWVVEVPFDVLYIRGLLGATRLARPQIHPQHLNFFTPQSLGFVAQVLGLRVLHIKSTVVLYWFGPTVSLRLYARHEAEPQPAAQLPYNFKNAAEFRSFLKWRLPLWRRWAGLMFRYYRFRTRSV
jgi:hypothetical protein